MPFQTAICTAWLTILLWKARAERSIWREWQGTKFKAVRGII